MTTNPPTTPPHWLLIAAPDFRARIWIGTDGTADNGWPRMRGQSEERVRRYCADRGWSVENA
jgi:hypothetical protein